ncbi:UNVERIFIED_CONTAM: Sister chromatid cohesion protein DCC1 [Sesamum radiatum]|uniref:Sister chromatid cohesion protein DCC1 n=1 Tax=Sesamum radiatum TaxID=300843 RepID=A0AAW2V7I7_SESRA
MDIIDLQSGCSGGAEAVLGLQPNSSISIAYHSLFGPHNDLLLLEVDEKFLPEILHQRVTLRGQPDEDAVLCTVSKTYAVKFVGTSNSVFLVPPTDKVSDLCNNKDDNMVVASVIKVAPGCMELVEVAPKLDKLKLLSQNPYGFSETADMDVSEEREKTRIGLYRWDDLVDRLQASDEELRMGLRSLSAIEIDGYWRILDDNI